MNRMFAHDLRHLGGTRRIGGLSVGTGTRDIDIRKQHVVKSLKHSTPQTRFPGDPAAAAPPEASLKFHPLFKAEPMGAILPHSHSPKNNPRGIESRRLEFLNRPLPSWVLETNPDIRIAERADCGYLLEKLLYSSVQTESGHQRYE